MSAVILLILRLAAAACLYAFLVWAFYTIWQELKQQSESQSFRHLPAVTLYIQDGAQPSPHLFHQTEIIIGRDPGCDLVLDDDSVSARHTRLSFHHSQWWAEDLQSKNGTHLNQEEILTPTVVVSGDVLRCGKTTLVITVD
jgi:pSer/pThr/pTyr-binding forkhead associated (FHA) protein